VATRTYQHDVAMRASPERILYALSHYEFFLEHGIHPALIRVRFLGERPGADGFPRRRYRNTERVRLGPLWITVSNIATSYLDASGALVGEAFQSPGIHVTVRSICTARPDGTTLVDESVRVDASAPLLGTTSAQAKRAHDEKLVKLKDMLEAGG
jgi:hypothetical protein